MYKSFIKTKTENERNIKRNDVRPANVNTEALDAKPKHVGTLPKRKDLLLDMKEQLENSRTKKNKTY